MPHQATDHESHGVTNTHHTKKIRRSNPEFQNDGGIIDWLKTESTLVAQRAEGAEKASRQAGWRGSSQAGSVGCGYCFWRSPRPSPCGLLELRRSGCSAPPPWPSSL